MKHPLLIASLVVSCALLPACEANTNTPSAANSTTIAAEITAHQAILLDVRTADEYAGGHVAQAVLMPYDSITNKIAQIAPDKNQKIYVYCRSGRRSGIAVETLKSMGYTQVTDLGGLGDLGQYGLTVQ